MGFAMSQVSDRLVNSLSAPLREFLLRHVHGPVPIEYRNTRTDKAHAARAALIRRELLLPLPPNTIRPVETELTIKGRDAVAKILAQAADALVAAGALDESVFAERPLAVLRRLKHGRALLPNEASEVPEAEELDEAGKLAL